MGEASLHSPYTDARGRSLVVDDPRRVVSLVPSLTETLIELGLADRLAGRTRYCIHPAERVRGIPAFGGTKNPHVDAIIALKPDLILACVEENKAEHLEAFEAAGLPVHAIYPRSLDDVAAFLSDYGRIFRAAEAVNPVLADLAAARCEADAFRVRLQSSRAGHSPRAATLIWKSPWMASGAGTYIHAVMAALGLEDAFASRQAYFEASLAELAALDLDLVLLPDEPYPFKEKEIRELAAAGVARGAGLAREAGSLLLVQGEHLSWYGTRTPRALRELIRILSAHFDLAP